MKWGQRQKRRRRKKIVFVHLIMWYNIKKEEVVHVPHIHHHTDD